jgi:hypothetical protein
MANRDYTKHLVSANEPSSSNLGDEWYNPSTNELYKRLVKDGTEVSWFEIPFGSTGFESGTSMLFVQSTAPVGWTKETSQNDKALRVVSGTAGTGGTLSFSTAFTARSISGAIGATTLSVAQMPSHDHGGATGSGGAATGAINTATFDFGNVQSASGVFSVAGNLPSRSQGSGGTGSKNTANLSLPNHTHTIGSQGGGESHTHTLSGSALDFSVQYIDVIIATKD